MHSVISRFFYEKNSFFYPCFTFLTEKSVQDKNVQTEDYLTDDSNKLLSKNSESPDKDPLPLNANKLHGLKAGLPNFEGSEKDDKMKMNGAPDITIIGTEITL